MPATKWTSLIAVIGLVASTVVVIIYHHGSLQDAANSLAILATIATGPMAMAFTGLYTVERTKNDLNNGLIPQKVEEAVNQGIVPPGPNKEGGT